MTYRDTALQLAKRTRGRWALSNPNFEKLLRVVIDVKRRS